MQRSLVYLTLCAFGSLLLAFPCSADNISLIATSVSVDVGRQNNIFEISGSDFFFTGFERDGNGLVVYPPGTVIELGGTLDSNNETSYESGSVPLGTGSHPATFTGRAQISSQPVIATPGPVTVPATIQGSYVGCLTPSPNDLGGCDESATTTYTVSVDLSGELSSYFFDRGDDYVLTDSFDFSATAAPEPSSLALLLSGLLLPAAWLLARPR